MRFTIERMRTLVLVAGVLLIVALGVFLAIGKWKSPFSRRDWPHRLGIDIQQEANGVTYTQAHGGHTLFKIHASKVVQLKQGNHALLHDVKIELYGEDGSRVDRIEGNEFEYDPKGGTARATGPVEITLMRPGVAPAIAPKATTSQVTGDKGKPTTLSAAAQTASAGEIHVKTSGLTFDQKSGVATTDQRVDFTLAQGAGSAIGATYDSQQGHLVLDHAVVLNVHRDTETVLVNAQHAEFERGDLQCHLRTAAAEYRGGKATAGEATILFREDGSAVRLDAASGFTLETAAGGHLAAPIGALEFDDHNQPRHGHMQGGVTMDSVTESGSQSGSQFGADQSRMMHGTSPTAELEFTPQGELRHAHLERGVQMHSEELSQSQGQPFRVSRDWRSPVADVDFRAAAPQVRSGTGRNADRKAGEAQGQVEPSAIRGTGGVVITGESQRGTGAVSPSRLAADEVTGTFGPGSVLTAMAGAGHASLQETSTTGSRQSSTGDRLEAHFAAPGPVKLPGEPAPVGKGTPGSKTLTAGAAQIESATLDGHVVLLQVPASKPGASPEALMRATAGHAVYEGTGEWLHLTRSPRVENGGLQLTADQVDVSQVSNDAFAHGNVKATWLGSNTDKNASQGKSQNGSAGPQGSLVLGGQGPAHVIADEAQLHQATGEATFRGQARLWQQANSVAAPVIVLDRVKQTLVARTTSAADPVRVVMVSAGAPSLSGSEPGKVPAHKGAKDASGKPAGPSVIRVRGGDLKYSDAERKAVMHGGALPNVVAETDTATSVSNEVELVLLPPGNHAGKDGTSAQVDRMTARGHVTVSSGGRRGTGEQLVYSSETGEYVLTGTAAMRPKMTDPVRGTVIGEALIFHSRDDSVSIEGSSNRTRTETTAPR